MDVFNIQGFPQVLRTWGGALQNLMERWGTLVNTWEDMGRHKMASLKSG